MLVGSAVELYVGSIIEGGFALQVPIMLLHLVGDLFGYMVVAAARYGKIVRRSAAIETSMESSVFAFLLAILHFSRYMVRVPAAVILVWMALVEWTLAVVWRYVPINSKPKFDRSLADRKGSLDKFLKAGD